MNSGGSSDEEPAFPGTEKSAESGEIIGVGVEGDGVDSQFAEQGQSLLMGPEKSALVLIFLHFLVV